MQTGVLWFDNTAGRDLALKVQEAAQCYREKFGTPANTCYVSASALSGELSLPLPGTQGQSLRVLPAANILPHHFWVGVEEPGELRRAA